MAEDVFLTSWDTFDLDAQGVPDRWDLAFLAHVLCDTSHPWHDAVRDLYLANVGLWELYAELYPADLGWVVDMGVQYYLGGMGVMGSVEQLYAGFGVGEWFTLGKANNEPLSALGDFDGDGLTNLEEAQQVQGVGGDAAAYVAAVTDPLNFWPGNPALPMAGAVALVALAGVVAFSASRLIRKK
jgi:hypothetical protein